MQRIGARLTLLFRYTMARTPKHTRAQLLDLARAAIAENPALTIEAFRKAVHVGSGDAKAAFAAACWEARQRHYSALPLEALDPKFRDLVQVGEPSDKAMEVSLDSAPDELRAAVDRALESARGALGDTIEALRATARRLIADAETQAASHVRAAEAHAQEAFAGLDASERHAAEAREETARVREQLTADIMRLSQELREEQRERVNAEAALRRADEERQRALLDLACERDAARATAAGLTRELVDAQKIAAAGEIRARGLEDALADTRQRLTDATEESSRALRDAAAAEARASLLATAHDAELQRIREAHAELVTRLEAHIADLVPADPRQRR